MSRGPVAYRAQMTMCLNRLSETEIVLRAIRHIYFNQGEFEPPPGYEAGLEHLTKAINKLTVAKDG